MTEVYISEDCESRLGRDPRWGFQSQNLMETVRLRKIQQPSQVERLLEALVSRGNLLPKECYQIRASGALSPQLQRVVERAIAKGHVWACWADSYHSWLFTCEMALPLSRERGAPVLQVDLYDEAGELKDAGIWMTDQEGKWTRCVA